MNKVKISLLIVFSIFLVLVFSYILSPKEIHYGKVIRQDGCYATIQTKENRTIDHVYCCGVFNQVHCSIGDNVTVKMKHWIVVMTGVCEMDEVQNC
jgi:hypothetical protein